MNILQNKLVQIALFPFSILYAMIITIRNYCYEHSLFKSYQIDSCKIISVGNISVGGTGKTPAVEYLANLIMNNNQQPAILSRGYKRKSKGLKVVSDGKNVLTTPEQSGDEPFLLARNLPHVPVVVENDRVKGASFIAETFNPDVIILDDAFQHRRLQRDLDIVLIDASKGIGNGLTIPSGILREPLNGLQRADIISLTRVDQSDHIKRTYRKLSRHTNCPMVESIHKPISINCISSHESYNLQSLHSCNVVIFSGIGNPQSFKKTISELNANIAAEFTFPDHYAYSESDISRIKNRASHFNAKFIITTEKDAMRLYHFASINSDFVYLKIRWEILSSNLIFNNILKL